VARRRYRQPVVDRVYRLAEGTVLDDCFQFWPALGVRAWFEPACGAGIRRAMRPCSPAVRL
jgi:hypothetical protein